MRQRTLGSEVAVRLLKAGDDMSDYVRESGSIITVNEELGTMLM